MRLWLYLVCIVIVMELISTAPLRFQRAHHYHLFLFLLHSLFVMFLLRSLLSSIALLFEAFQTGIRSVKLAACIVDGTAYDLVGALVKFSLVADC